MAGVGVVVVVVPVAGDGGTVVEVVVVEVPEESQAEGLVEEFDDEESEGTVGWAAASGANSASTPAAVDVAPSAALSDHTTVRTSFWTI
jgi:hypothetical protein